MKKNKKKKINKKIVVLAIIILITIIVLISVLYNIIQLIIEPTGVFVIENGKIYDEETAVGYIIRDEELISTDTPQNGIVTIKLEGEKVSKGDAVYRYCSTNEDALEQKIAELDKEIQEAMKGQNTGIYSTDIQLLEKQIDEKVKLIQSTNDINLIAEYKDEISANMIKKAKIAGELSPSGSYVKKLIEQRSEYENQLNSGQKYIMASRSGIVSYKIDGYENVLKEDIIDSITVKGLSDIKIKTGQAISSSSEHGKIVNNFYCYIATILSSDRVVNVSPGKTIKLRLSNNDEVSAEIVKISDPDNGEVVVIFKVTQDVEYLINYRKISIDVIWWNASGLKVPNSAIIVDGDKNYLIRSRVGYTDKILIKVERQNDYYSIISNYTTQELKDMGYTTDEISKMKSISLYDEIVLNPDT